MIDVKKRSKLNAVTSWEECSFERQRYLERKS